MAKSSHKKTRSARKNANMYVMVGCSKKCRKHKTCKHKKRHICPNCGPNCKCGKVCNCPSPCPGNCNEKSIYGGCGSCSVLKGGNFYKPASPITGPNVGSNWGTNFNKWPGVDGISGNRNSLPYNHDVYKNPSYQQSMNDSGYKYLNSKIGGYKYNKIKKNVSFSTSHTQRSPKFKKIYKRGGSSLVPQALGNLKNEIGFNFNSAYNALNGYPAPVDPLPYKGQLTGQLNKLYF